MSRFIKNLIGGYLAAREFEQQIKLIEGLIAEEDKVQVRLPLRHLKILKTCAALGVKNSDELYDRLDRGDHE